MSNAISPQLLTSHKLYFEFTSQTQSIAHASSRLSRTRVSGGNRAYRKACYICMAPSHSNHSPIVRFHRCETEKTENNYFIHTGVFVSLSHLKTLKKKLKITPTLFAPSSIDHHFPFSSASNKTLAFPPLSVFFRVFGRFNANDRPKRFKKCTFQKSAVQIWRAVYDVPCCSYLVAVFAARPSTKEPNNSQVFCKLSSVMDGY